MVLSIGFVGMAIGAAVGGFIADRVGRKTVFTATLIIFGIATVPWPYLGHSACCSAPD